MNRLRFIFMLLLSAELKQVYGVWPMPQHISHFTERYVLHPHQFSYKYSSDSAARHGCSLLDAAFKRYFRIIFPDFEGGTEFRKTWSEAKPFTVSVSVRTVGCDEYPNQDSDESYNLSVSAGEAMLRAESVWGALRGLESFSQLVYEENYNSYYVNKTEIVDFPRFPFRGLLLDTSRHYLPVHVILKTLDAMAYNKFNVFHWHIVDDPSFPYQSRLYPDLSNKGAFHPVTHIYTQSDVRKVISHARFRGIRVVPEFDSPGHTQSWGKGQPDLLTTCYKRTGPSGTFGPINPSLGSSYQFMSNLLKEVSSVFPDTFVHLGGDEVDFACWKSNPNVQAFMAKMGFGNDYKKLESFYMESIMNISAAFNKTAIVWQDVFDFSKQIRTQYVVEVWKRGCYLCNMHQVAKAGLKIILAAPFYLDLPGPTHNWARYYTVRPLSFKGTEQQKKLVIGGEVCMWGEYVDAANLSPRLWPRASAAAERLWSDEEQTSSVEKAFPRLQDFRCKMIREPGLDRDSYTLQHHKRLDEQVTDLTGSYFSKRQQVLENKSQ
ncbi:beta-hexosaminidase subunit alpha isoform X1 [Silurus asotus]|uniref:Beta-hexosaminidase n=1 Tax=Silurus asotus TaxID=30991 RepID=A0AAD5B1Z3_SILAS|nr:beta-hexosaminidase subunit alpha isoform X1 [Silurus asotus]